ncbi:MAG TPA: SRPBCC family protein [Acidimicrobiales bacterium]
MREIHGQAEAVIEGSPRAVFSTITDIERLPEWNRAIEQVVERPSGLTPGATWIVEMHPSPGLRWRSVSTLQDLDVDGLRFSYRTVNADGNPSYALWSWDLTPTPAGVRVAVRWDVYLETIDRRLLAGPIRQRQLRKEVAASLAALAARVPPSTV